MGLIPDETINEVRDATDIVALIEGYFPLKRRGQDFWAVCPFHSESTPSFKVSPAQQNYHCFGCGVGGDAIRFVREYESLDFPSAVKRLAAISGIVIREEETTPAERARTAMRSQLVTLHQEAADWFNTQLLERKEHDAERARAYLKNRGIGSDIAGRWKIGFAPADGRVFSEWAKGKGYSGRLMIASGLMAQREDNDPSRGLYSRFRDRVMFPINNDFGDTVAFSGRVLDPEAKTAKYVNSPETLLFNKSKIFFGLDKSKRAISKAEAVIICEGQLDMIRCFESGVENVVAPLGTAFTEHHSRTLRRFAGDRGEALLCFDSDSAGYKAAGRAYIELSSSGLFVRSVELPDGEDPDSLITSQGPDAFRERVAAARPFYHYQIDRLSGSIDMSDPRGRVKFADEVAPTIAIIGDPVAREAMVNEVATRLGIAAGDFRKRVASAAKDGERKTRSYELDQEPPRGVAPATIDNPDARIILRLALTDEDTLRWMGEVKEQAVEQLATVPGAGLLTKFWKQLPPSVKPADINAHLARFEDAEAAALTALTMARFAPIGLLDAQRALIRMRYRTLESERAATVTQTRDPNLDKSQIFELTSKSETQRKELLELKAALKNIAPPRA